MIIKVSISDCSKMPPTLIAEGEFSVSGEGDLSNAIKTMMGECRKITKKSMWDMRIDIREA